LKSHAVAEKNIGKNIRGGEGYHFMPHPVS